LDAELNESTTVHEAASAESTEPSGEGTATPPRRRRRRSRGRGRGTGPGVTQAPAGESAAAEEGGAEETPSEEPAGPEQQARTAARRRRSRGGRGRKPAGATAATAKQESAEGEALEPVIAEAAGSDTEQSAEGAPALTPAAKRRRRRRGGRGRSKPAGTEAADDATEAVEPLPVEEGSSEPPAEASTRPRTQRRTRTRKAPEAAPKKAEGAEKAEGTARPRTRTARTVRPEKAEGAEATQTVTRGRRSAPRTGLRRRRERLPEVIRATDKTMLITEIGDRDQIAVLEDRVLVEHYITRAGARSMVGNIYLGKVQNVLPGMEAAFVDLGRGRNAVLYAGEVSYDEEVEGSETPRIEKILRAGQNVLVQVTKDPMGGKGARLTQEVSLPGRYLVLVPGSPDVFGISRRLPDEERRRLKEILKKVKSPEHGMIVRTAAEGADGEDLTADFERLVSEWTDIDKSAKKGKAPRLLYEEPELTVRVVRDLFTGGEFKEMITDSVPIYDQVVAYLKGVAPELVSKVKMHEGKLPILEAYHASEQIHKALERKVWLPSGGYIVIDKTEAMTVIDVNTGKHVGKANLEETVTKTNLEAAEEVARQLRLRDIGGMIVVDFIDMLMDRNKEKVIDAVRGAMARDKTRSQVFDISPLGILEITRKRVSAGLLESFSEVCPTCEGRGILITHKL
jgi:ribonuclease E